MSSIFLLEDSTCHVLPRSWLLIPYVALLDVIFIREVMSIVTSQRSYVNSLVVLPKPVRAKPISKCVVGPETRSSML